MWVVIVQPRLTSKCSHGMAGQLPLASLKPFVQVKSHTCAIRREQSCEFSEWPIKCPSLATRLIVVYRPTYLKEHLISPAIFNEEFGECLQRVILSKEPVLITGDFDFHVDDCSEKGCCKIQRYIAWIWTKTTCKCVNSQRWTHARSFRHPDEW